MSYSVGFTNDLLDRTTAETLEAFLALVNWVETGTVPAGGGVTR